MWFFKNTPIVVEVAMRNEKKNYETYPNFSKDLNTYGKL